jgi:hypothetical protein
MAILRDRSPDLSVAHAGGGLITTPFPQNQPGRNDGDNYFTISFQQLTQTPARAHAIFIMGVGMSVRYGAWVFGVPSYLTIAY